MNTYRGEKARSLSWLAQRSATICQRKETNLLRAHVFLSGIIKEQVLVAISVGKRR